jgi:mannose-6-phosphate isomerase-like protein (cupin superfamily)
MTEYRLTGLSRASTHGPIQTFDQLGGGGVVWNTALAIPVHLGGPWNSIEYVSIPPLTDGVESAVGEHVQGTDEIYFIHRGEGWLTTNGLPCPVAAGDLVIAPKGTRHSIRNPSPQQPLAFLVVELKAPGNGGTYQPTLVGAFPSFLQESDTFHPASIGGQSVLLRVASVDLSAYFSAPWGRLSLVEIPPEGCVDGYREVAHDENVFVVDGSARVCVAHHCFDSDENGLNVLVPRGVPHWIANRSSTAPLTVLCLTVCRDFP